MTLQTCLELRRIDEQDLQFLHKNKKMLKIGINQKVKTISMGAS